MIAVCIKWIDKLPTPGVSAADEAAIELALRHAEATGDSVTAVTVGGPVADSGLRNALARGVAEAVRVHAPEDTESEHVADALGPVVASSRAVWCGDASLDRGSGSVPAFLAARLHRQQALGLVGVQFDDVLRVIRRLDGGRREVLRITGPAVLSVEGSVARLRRASLRAALSARSEQVLVHGTSFPSPWTPPAVVSPYRPRARVLAGPSGATALHRLRCLVDASAAQHAGETIEVDATAAAARIIEVLREWGYLEPEQSARTVTTILPP